MRWNFVSFTGWKNFMWMRNGRREDENLSEKNILIFNLIKKYKIKNIIISICTSKSSNIILFYRH